MHTPTRAQERLDIVRRGAMGGGQLGREQADFWFDLLLEHEESIADILMVRVLHGTRCEGLRLAGAAASRGCAAAKAGPASCSHAGQLCTLRTLPAGGIPCGVSAV